MPWLLIVVEPRGQLASRPVDEAQRLVDRMTAYCTELQQRGILLRAESLRNEDHAVRICTPANDQRAQLREGPLAGSGETVTGFFLIDVDNGDEAVAVARDCPAIHWATVEVRECLPSHAPPES
jgi:hypothetical protein